MNEPSQPFDALGPTQSQAASSGDPHSLPSTLAHDRQNETSIASARQAEDAPAGWTPQVAGRYRNLTFHAKGGMGVVFVAEDGELNRRIALKAMQPERASDPENRRRFVREAEITGALEHPGVAPVYSLSCDAQGNPVYAMRFIHGQSLGAAIRKFHESQGEINRSLAFRQLLRRFQDACHTLDFAHSKGVVHRDLKPDNIMLGDFGETLVVDWGLARLGAGDSAEPLRGAAFEGDSADQTADGTVMGTPAFMSPEQAAGRISEIGPASDIYSLGATLYFLLANRSPFQGQTRDLLQRIGTGDFPRPRDANPAVPRPLEAICMKAMALAPGARYASAAQLAEDIEHFLADEPVSAHRESAPLRWRRWLRKRPRLATGGAVALLASIVGLSAIAAVQTRAKSSLAATNIALEKQRRRAQSREDAAIAAFTKFGDAVKKEPRLKDSPELGELRQRLLREPQAFFRELKNQLEADNDSQPRSLERLASANGELALLNNEIGDKTDALAAARQSLAVFQNLAEAHPEAAEHQSGLAKSHYMLASLLVETGGLAEAQTQYEAALKLLRRLADESPQVVEHQNSLAEAHNALGVVLTRTSHAAQAHSQFESALAIFRRLADSHPDAPQHRHSLARTHGNLGALLEQQGDTAGAEREYNLAIGVWDELIASFPDLDEHRDGWAAVRTNLARLRQRTGDAIGARASLEAALESRKTLADRRPSNTSYQADVASSLQDLGTQLMAAGEIEAAKERLQSALAIREKLAADHPTVADFQSDLASAHNNLALVFLRSGDRIAARARYESAKSILGPIVEQHPQVADYGAKLASSKANLASLLAELGELELSRAEFDSAIPMITSLAERHPDAPAHQADLVDAHANYGLVLIRIGDLDAAQQHLETAAAVGGKLLRSRPSFTQHHSSLANSHANLGLVRLQRGDNEAAAQDFQLAVDMLQKLVAAHRQDPDYASRLGGALHNLAMIELRTGQIRTARQRLLDAADWQRQALAKNPNNPQFRQFMTNHLNLLLQITAPDSPESTRLTKELEDLQAPSAGGGAAKSDTTP